MKVKIYSAHFKHHSFDKVDEVSIVSRGPQGYETKVMYEDSENWNKRGIGHRLYLDIVNEITNGGEHKGVFLTWGPILATAVLERLRSDYANSANVIILDLERFCKWYMPTTDLNLIFKLIGKPQFVEETLEGKLHRLYNEIRDMSLEFNYLMNPVTGGVLLEEGKELHHYSYVLGQRTMSKHASTFLLRLAILSKYVDYDYKTDHHRACKYSRHLCSIESRPINTSKLKTQKPSRSRSGSLLAHTVGRTEIGGTNTVFFHTMLKEFGYNPLGENGIIAGRKDYDIWKDYHSTLKEEWFNSPVVQHKNMYVASMAELDEPEEIIERIRQYHSAYA